jgi:hypothetical protein
MATNGVRSTVRTGAGSSVEKTRVLLLGGLIATGIGAYVFLTATGAGGDKPRTLLPFQALARTLPESEQARFRSIRQAELAAAAERARTSRWPEVQTLADAGIAPFAADRSAGEGGARWERFQRGTTVNYIGVPADPAAPAWLLAIQEPEPGALPDPSPEDEEHHRLPDGTMLHIYVWTHRYGGRVESRFVAQPQNEGWTQLFNAPPNPVQPVRR